MAFAQPPPPEDKPTYLLWLVYEDVFVLFIAAILLGVYIIYRIT
jgi:hypothetical protein